MSMEDDMFNVPENDDEMNEEDDDMDTQEPEPQSQYMEDGGDEENEENDEEDEDNDENDDDDNDEEEDEEEEDDDDENDKDDDEKDDAKFVDAADHGSPKEGDTQASQNNKSTKAPTEKEVKEAAEKEAADKEAGISTREALIRRAKTSYDLDIVPSVAIPYASQCHAIALTDGPKWIITGGEDGFIRKYDLISSIQGKAPLTMAQKHNLVDSVNKAGVINSYWENEQPYTKEELMKANPKVKSSDFTTGSISYEPKINPVYALDVERNGYWCLSGVLSGGISLYTMRYNEGALHHYFRHGNKNRPLSLTSGHTNAISSLKLNQSQDKFLSGSWDKTIRQWDLNTGDCTDLMTGASGQISQIQFRPQGLADLTLDFSDSPDDQKSDMESLFGDSDEEGEKPAKKPDVAPVSTSKTLKNESVFMSSHSDGTVNIWDLRAATTPVIKYDVPAGTPPWCMSSSWSNNGEFIYVGRRNSTVHEFSIKMPHKKHGSSYSPYVSKTLQFPKISGPVTALTTMPNDNYLLCGSSDNIRLYNLSLYNAEDPANVIKDAKKTQATPFLIIPGHHSGVLSALYVDETCRFMVSASGNRGWGNSNYTESVIVYEIDFDSK